jgi:hypothetical protein
MPRIVFLDTETTGLSLDADIWEIAMIVRDPGMAADVEFEFFVEHDIAKAAALPESFRADHDARYDPEEAFTRRDAVWAVWATTRDAHIVGAVPNFDTERLALLLRAHGFEPAWHYHLIDVESLVVGALYGRSTGGEISGAVDLPWDSDWLAKQVGVEITEGARHTAGGDARWARDIWDAVTG